MSITSGDLAAARADSPAPRSLFARLIDDAAVFPPGLAPLPQAVADHLAGADHPSADLVGPLLIAASSAPELRDLDRAAALRVVLIARVGTPLATVSDGLETLAGLADIDVAAVEIGWSEHWQDALAWGRPVTVEVPRESASLATALAELGAHRGSSEVLIQAKLRTGSTPAQPVPTSAELAHFIASCVEADQRFKLTGGLHHVLAHTTADGEDQHGLLNVLAATHQAIQGAQAPAVESTLAGRDARALVAAVADLTSAEATAVRGLFTAYGCCGVLDPIGELAALGLID